MRKSWLFALAVIVVGGLAGVAIAGRPEPADPFLLDPNITLAIVPSSTSEADTSVTTARAATTTIATTTPSAVATTSTVLTATSTTEAPTTVTGASTTTVAGPLPRDQVRLVLANGDGRFRLASITADRIRPLGYIIDLGDPLRTVDATIIYYRPGFEDEADIVASDISVPGAIIAELPTNSAQAITNSDDRGDVIVVLGSDAPR